MTLKKNNESINWGGNGSEGKAYELQMFGGAVEEPARSDSIKALINLAKDLKSEAFAIFRIEESGIVIDTPENLMLWYDNDGSTIWAIKSKGDSEIAKKEFKFNSIANGKTKAIKHHLGNIYLNELYNNKIIEKPMKLTEVIQEETKKWMGRKPTNCDICHNGITDWWVDGKTKFGPWANMCSQCFGKHGIGMGLGKGQKYNANTLEKIEEENLWMKNSALSPDNNIKECKKMGEPKHKSARFKLKESQLAMLNEELDLNIKGNEKQPLVEEENIPLNEEVNRIRDKMVMLGEKLEA